MSALATTDQVRAIKAAQRRLGMPDGDYRALLGRFAVVSSRELTTAQAGEVLDALNGSSNRTAKHRATGPFAKKLQALWLSAYHLGIVREPDDAALLAFAERQTGLSHTRFLTDPQDAARVIEALKAMLIREGGVTWPAKPGAGAINIKRAVVEAQIRRLAELGFGLTCGMTPANTVWVVNHGAGPDLDRLARRVGETLRDARREEE